jgi:hypothetical protein
VRLFLKQGETNAARHAPALSHTRSVWMPWSLKLLLWPWLLESKQASPSFVLRAQANHHHRTPRKRLLTWPQDAETRSGAARSAGRGCMAEAPNWSLAAVNLRPVVCILEIFLGLLFPVVRRCSPSSCLSHWVSVAPTFPFTPVPCLRLLVCSVVLSCRSLRPSELCARPCVRVACALLAMWNCCSTFVTAFVLAV